MDEGNQRQVGESTAAGLRVDSDKLEERERDLERAFSLCEFSVSRGVSTRGRWVGAGVSWEGRAGSGGGTQ